MILHRDNILREQKELKLLNQQLQAQIIALQNRFTQAEGDAKNGASSDLRVLEELIQKRIVKAKLPQHLVPTTRLHEFPLFKDIQECELLKKFLTPALNSYTGASDLIQHIRHFQDKTMLYSRNDQVMCLTFPSSLRGAMSEWFSLPPRSLHNFSEITEAFLTQYATG